MHPNPERLNIDVSPSNPWILQERLEGTQYCLQGICKDGKVLSSVAYSSEFTVSKSSVFFENTGKGDLGQIIEKVAAHCGYTGIISFDVMLCEDGSVRPIECNPRATSALHPMAPTTGLMRPSFTAVQSGAREPHEGWCCPCGSTWCRTSSERAISSGGGLPQAINFG